MSYLVHTKMGRLDEAVFLLEEALTPVADEFDSILVTGLSGIVPGSIIAHKLGKRLVVLRKPGEPTHGQEVEGAYDWADSDKDYVIVDDFVAGGKTMTRLLDAHPGEQPPKYICLYNETSNLTTTQFSSDMPEGQQRWTLLHVPGRHRCLFTLGYIDGVRHDA